MKHYYNKPTIEIYEYSVEDGFNSFPPIIPEEQEDPRGCSCGAPDCICNSRSECTGNMLDYCHRKH